VRTVVYAGNGRFSLDPEMPLPKLDEHDVLVKVRYCGICGSDLHHFQATGYAERIRVLGHEISGRVEDIGRGVGKVERGDRVTALCDGGYSEYVKVIQDDVIPLPDHVTYEQAALSEPLAIGLRSVRDSGLRLGDKAAIVGTGPIGLYTLAAAKAAGALEVYVSEISPARREAAKRMGATAVFDPKSQDVPGELKRRGVEGVDVVYDCAGARGTLKQSIDMLKRGGTVVVIGLSGKPDEIDTRWFFRAGKVMAIPAAKELWPMSVELIAKGKIDPAAIISNIITLEELPDYMQALQKPDAHVQVLVDPWGKRF